MKTVGIALKMFLTMMILTGLLYPLLITLIAQLSMPQQAGGYLIKIEDQIRGSALIAQHFKGEAYFWPRPSAIDYDPMKPSGGSNLGPTSQKLKEIVEERKKNLAFHHPPAELVYASGSGLDPHISVEAAYFQLNRIIKARSITDQEQLLSLIESSTEGFSKKYLNVLLLNIHLDQQFPLKRS